MEETKSAEELLVERAEAVAKKLEEENRKAEKLLTRQALGGKSDAGASQPPPKEETAQEYAARILKGRR